MNRLLTAALMVLFGASGVSGAPVEQRGPRNIGKAPRGGVRVPGPPAARAPIQEVIEGFYVSRVQRELELEDGEFARVLPALRESLEERNELGQNRTRAFNALRRALRESDTTDEELDRLVRDLDEAERGLRAVQDSLLKSVDPELSSRQRARMRIIQPNIEDRIRGLIERSRNANRPPPPGGHDR